MTDENAEPERIVWKLLPKMPVFQMSLTYSFLTKGIVKVEENVDDETGQNKTAIESFLARTKYHISGYYSRRIDAGE